MGAGAIATIIGTAGSILQNKIQNEQSKENIEHAAAVNYAYGERSADNAQAGTKALYSELFSPEAKVKQLKEAGLSVGMMYGQIALFLCRRIRRTNSKAALSHDTIRMGTKRSETAV